MNTPPEGWAILDIGHHNRLADLFGAAHHDVHRNLDPDRVTCIDIHTNGDGVYRVFPDGRVLHNPDIR